MNEKAVLARFAKTMEKSALLAENGRALQYRLFAPELKPGERYPLVLFLHGAGARGWDNERQLEQMGGVNPFALPEAQAEHPCYVAAPQCAEGADWAHPGMPELLKALVEELLDNCAVDPMRVYITGRSMGGFGAWHMIARYPDLFAAAMPVCGGGAPEEMGKIGQLPVWAFHAADDDIVPVAGEMQGAVGTRRAVEAARQAGSRNIRYTEYPAGMIGEKWGGAHYAWSEAYRDAEALQWLFAQKKAAQGPTELERYRKIADAMTREIILSKQGLALPYRLFAPAQKPGERHPLVVFLHGMNARGRDNEAQVTQTSGAFLYADAKAQAETPCYVLAPQCPEGIAWMHPGVPELLKALIDETIAKHAVDPMRVSVTGLSMGGYGAWHMAGKYPDLFAAAMPICGGGTLEAAERIGQLPVWAFHAVDDDSVPAGEELRGRVSTNGAIAYGSRLTVQACRAAGSMNVRYTEYPAGMIGAKWYGPHAAWEEAYRDDEARRWLLAQNRLDRYEYKSVAPGVWAIADAMGDSFYVIDGLTRALVIDTGMARADIRAVIGKLTPCPYDLALTHGHGDHSFHAPLFDKVYLAEADKDMLYAHRFEGQASPDEKALTYIGDGDELDLGGGITVKIVALPGHTPGTLLFVDSYHKCVFTGDAIGSGCGVWMQVPTGSSLSDYAKAIAAAKEKLVALGVEPAGWAFLGGHDNQKYTSAVSGYNPPSLEMMDDLIALCGKLIAGELAGSEDTGLPPATANRFGRVLKATHGKAEMLYRPEQVR